MNTITFFGVSVRGDCEGKTRKDKAFFSIQEEAEKFAKGCDWYGDDGVVTKRQVVLFDSCVEAHDAFTYMQEGK